MKPPFESYSGSDAFTFVCYSHRDSDLVYPELVWLRDQGLNIWYDEGIAPGEEWPDRIAWAIEHANQILFYVSPQSVQSRVCRDEVRLASTEGKSIVTVQLEPTKLTGGLGLTLGSSQAVVKDSYRTLEAYRTQLSSILLHSATINLSSKSRRVNRPALYVLVVLVFLIVLPAIYYQYVFKAASESILASPEVKNSQSSIAVLPLVDMSSDRNLAYLGEGVAEALIHGLAQIAGINVIARTSSFHFKDQELDAQSIGAQLGVNTVLEGSIRKEEDRLRITLQLINVEDGFHIWSKQFDGFMSSIFKLQDEIAQDVMHTVRPDLDIPADNEFTDAGTKSPLAYEAFLIGTYERTQQTRDSIDRAIEHFQLAIKHDPDFGRAYESLIDAYDFKGYYYGNREEMMALARQVLEQARINDKDSSDTNWFWAEQLVQDGESIHVRFREAEELYSLMIRNRSHVANGGNRITGFFQYALLLAKSGLYDAAIAFMVPLETIDPMSIDIKLRLAEFYAAVYDYEKALATYTELMVLSPGYVQAKLDVFLIYGTLGQIAEAEVIRNELATGFSADLTQLLDTYLVYWRGDKQAAITSLDDLANSREVPANYKALSYLAFGENPKAFSFLNVAADQGDPYASELMLTQARTLSRDRWQSVKQSEEFMSFMNRYGYDENWPAELEDRANGITDYTKVVVRAKGG